MSKFERHGPCEKCGSSDAVAWYSDGHGVCFSCAKYYNHNGKFTERNLLDNIEPTKKDISPLTNVFRAIPRRGLSEQAIRKYQIDVNMDRSKDIAHRYPFFRHGRHVANQIRKRSAKEFYWEGDTKGLELFGQHLFEPGGRAVTVCEGAIDAPSAWLLTNSLYPCVSVVSAAGALDQCRTNYEYLNSFDEIVLCFDNDEAKYRPDGSAYHPGQDAAKAVAEMFAPGKCRILTLREGKDASEYLQKKIDHSLYVKEWWKAPRFMPDGLVFGHDLWDEIINAPEPYCVPTPIEGLNRLIYGLRLGEMVTFTAPPKIGKTTVLKTIEYALLKNPELIEKHYGIGFMHLEETKKDLAVDLMGHHLGKRLLLPDTPKTEEELREAYDATVNTDRVVIWDHFGSNKVDNVVNKIRHMSALGCKYIVLDHFSILASDMSNPDERKVLDEIATRLKTLTVELDICLIGVVHQNRRGEIRGTAAFEQLSNIVIRLDRDKLDADAWRRNVMVLTVTENRFSGRTGPASYLFYDETTGKFSELDEEARQKYDEGRSISDADVPFQP